jgi:cell division protein FtsB
MSLPNKRKKFFSTPAAIFLLLVLLSIFLAVPLLNNFSKRQQIDSEITGLRQEIEKLEGGNNDLKELLAYLKSDQFAENQARLNFGLKKPGEEVVVVKSEEGVKIIAGAENGENETSNPGKWLRYFLQARK